MGGTIYNTSKVKKTEMCDTSVIYNYCDVTSTILGANSSIGDYSKVTNSIIGNYSSVQRFSHLNNVKLGDFSYTGMNFVGLYCEIGKFSSISWNVSIGGANHDYLRTTTHPILYKAEYGFIQSDSEKVYDRFDNECMIGNDVWIGEGVSICRNVKVGDGAVIGAGAVVTKDVPPYSIVAGVPSKEIKKRFDKEVINLLLGAKWWDFPIEIIKENFTLISAKMNLEVANQIMKIRKSL